MVAGGGASVVYSDTICDIGGSEELANYGEYSGAPRYHQFSSAVPCSILQRITDF